MTDLPSPSKAVRALLPSSDTHAPYEYLGDGSWLFAGHYALIHVADSADSSRAHVIDSGMWYEVRSIRWEADTQLFICTWVDPSRPQLIVRTDSDNPAEFMREVTRKVNHTLVSHREVTAPNGTTITAYIRRRDDEQLFSVLTADGPLDEEGHQLASHLEFQLRESVGLD